MNGNITLASGNQTKNVPKPVPWVSGGAMKNAYEAEFSKNLTITKHHSKNGFRGSFDQIEHTQSSDVIVMIFIPNDAQNDQVLTS